MPDEHKNMWRRFIRNNLLVYVLTNVGFNFIISYGSFISAGDLHLFEGSQCVARFLLPLAFFVPLIISVDVTNRLKKFNAKHDLKIPLFERKGYQKKFFIHSLKYGLVAGCLITGLMGLVQSVVSKTFAFPPLWTSLFIALTAGFLASFFMIQTIKLHGFNLLALPFSRSDNLQHSTEIPMENTTMARPLK